MIHPTVFFECPHAGVYLFSLTIQTLEGYYGDYSMMQDNSVVATAAVDPNGHDPTGASVVIIECASGERMWVRTGGSSACLMGGADQESIFSGYMLSPYD